MGNADRTVLDELWHLSETPAQADLSARRGLIDIDIVRIAIENGAPPSVAVDALLRTAQEYAASRNDWSALAGAALCQFDPKLRSNSVANAKKGNRAQRAAELFAKAQEDKLRERGEDKLREGGVAPDTTKKYGPMALVDFAAAIREVSVLARQNPVFASNYFIRAEVRDVSPDELAELLTRHPAIPATETGANPTAAPAIRFTDELGEALRNLATMHEQRQWPVYTIDLLHAIACMPTGRIMACFAEVLSGRTFELEQWFLRRRADHPTDAWSPVDWTADDNIMQARQLALADGADHINEYHVLLGILANGSRTRTRLTTFLQENGTNIDALCQRVEMASRSRQDRETP